MKKKKIAMMVVWSISLVSALHIDLCSRHPRTIPYLPWHRGQRPFLDRRLLEVPNDKGDYPR